MLVGLSRNYYAVTCSTQLRKGLKDHHGLGEGHHGLGEGHHGLGEGHHGLGEGLHDVGDGHHAVAIAVSFGGRIGERKSAAPFPDAGKGTAASGLLIRWKSISQKVFCVLQMVQFECPRVIHP